MGCLPFGMNRRELLAAAGLGAGAFLAGCLGNGDGGGPAETDSPTSSRSVAETTFDVVENTCGEGRDEASVSFGDHVSVSGTIRGSNTCYTATLDGATYDAAADRLTVRVRSSVPEGRETAACGQCLVDIDYDAAVRFEGGLPGTVVVEHDGEQVASAER